MFAEQGKLTMEVRRLVCFGLTVIGLSSLLLLSVVPPANIVLQWRAYAPYVVLSAAILMARGREELNPLIFVTLLVVVAGTWAYLDSGRFNMVLSWNTFGLVEDYVPIFQLIAIVAFICVVILRRCKTGKTDT